MLYNIKHHMRYFIHMDFCSLLTLVEASFAKVSTDLFEKLYPPLAIEENFKRYVNDIIPKELNESIMSIKDSLIDALKEKNFRLQQKVQYLEKKLSGIEIA